MLITGTRTSLHPPITVTLTTSALQSCSLFARTVFLHSISHLWTIGSLKSIYMALLQGHQQGVLLTQNIDILHCSLYFNARPNDPNSAYQLDFPPLPLR